MTKRLHRGEEFQALNNDSIKETKPRLVVFLTLTRENSPELFTPFISILKLGF
jgi:hypothetical protein